MLPRVCWEVCGCRLVAFNNGLYFVYDLLAALARHLGVHADGDHVLVGGEASEVDGGGAFVCEPLGGYFCMVFSFLLRNTFARHGKASKLPLLT